MNRLLLLACLACLACPTCPAATTVDPTFLYRKLSRLKPQPNALTSKTTVYRPIFGEGDAQAGIVKGVARFGEVVVNRGGRSQRVSFPQVEHILVVLEGAGTIDYAGTQHSLAKHDFLYLPPDVTFELSSIAENGLRGILMGFRIPAGTASVATPPLQIANIDDVPAQVVGTHPPSTLYRLLLGDTKSTRDRIAAGHTVTSLFMMEFAPGGTNTPHHHEKEEEIYLLLDGAGEMVAGGGADGTEGRRPARPGDAYFFRLNATVGFYNSGASNTKKARILAVRSNFPFSD